MLWADQWPRRCMLGGQRIGIKSKPTSAFAWVDLGNKKIPLTPDRSVGVWGWWGGDEVKMTFVPSMIVQVPLIAHPNFGAFKVSHSPDGMSYELLLVIPIEEETPKADISPLPRKVIPRRPWLFSRVRGLL